MLVLIAAGEMKGSLSAAEAASAIAQGVHQASPGATIYSLALSDGGAGLVDLMAASSNAEIRTTRVTGPVGAPVQAQWAYIPPKDQNNAGGEAIIEMSAAAGFALVPLDQRNPERTSTFGVGQLIRAAMDAGCTNITIGIGNSATCDAGIGMAAAFGARFIGPHDRPIDRPVGADLMQIKKVDLSEIDPRISQTRFTVLCDVSNPLFGSTGSAHVFAPQKGATTEQVQRLDAGLRILASLLPDTDPDTPGMGAAGGLAFGLAAFCGATLAPGADTVLDLVEFDARARAADLVITCEGRLDKTSLLGKLPCRVVKRAQTVFTPAIILAGSVDLSAAHTLRVAATTHAISPPSMPIHEAIERAAELMADASARAVHLHPHP